MLLTMTNRHKTEQIAIRDAVTEHYLATWRHASVHDIAARLGWSESKIRRVIRDSSGAIAGTTSERVSVARYSRNYPGMEAGYTMAWAYLPSRSHLGELLLAARAMQEEK